MEIVMASMLFFTLILLASLGLRVIEGMERENRLAEAELQASQLYRDSLDSRVEQVRRYRHDADGLLRAIEHSIGDEAGVLVGAAVSSDEDEPSLGFGFGRYQLPLAEAAVQSKRRLCSDEGIAFTCEIDPGFAVEAAGRGISEPDLCIVLQNLLDNAYEASLEAKGAGIAPAMSLRLDAREGGGLDIVAGNRTASTTAPTFRTGKANPKLHGVGLQVVNDIARSHGGNLSSDFDSTTHVLTMTVRL